MNALIVILPTVLVTASAVLYGYWLANKHNKLNDCDFCKELSFKDSGSDTPIADQMDRDYGFKN
jgi:hypothetical protein